MDIYIYGMHDRIPDLSIADRAEIASCDHFAGGKRHFELLKGLLPSNSSWSNITVPLHSLFNEMRENQGTWCVFASGDPLFFGIGITLKREFPEANIEVKSVFNSLQLLGHRLLLPYGEFRPITLTGRPWFAFDEALVNGVTKMAVLTDRKKTPKTIAERMLAAGFDNFTMHLGEKMGGNEERVRSLSIKEALDIEFIHPNCLYLEATEIKVIRKGIPETDLETLEGRPKMITKMPVRLTTLAFMNLQNHHTLWDVGACSGSISIDAKLHHPKLDVYTFEIRPESDGIIRRNAVTFHAPGITPIIGDFVDVEKSHLPKPDVIFLGGYGGDMDRVFSVLNTYLLDDGIIAFNAVSPKSQQAFEDCVVKYNFEMETRTVIGVDEHNPIKVFVARNRIAN